MSQQIGGALGVAVVISVYATGAVAGEFVPGLREAFLAGGALAASAAIIAVFTVGRRPRRSDAQAAP
jgi:hypothetical protein